MKLIEDTNWQEMDADTARRDKQELTERSVVGCILMDNDSIYRIPDLKPEHFYTVDLKEMFQEASRQIISGKRCDPITLIEALTGKIQDAVSHITDVAQSVYSSASIERHAAIVMDLSVKRNLSMLGREMTGLIQSKEPSDILVDRMASKVEALAQKKTQQEPLKLADMLSSYVDVVQDRMEGKIKPLSTGFKDLDERLDGGLERGTLTVIAARPAMGKTAMALSLSRNVAEYGSSLFLSMEMSKDQVNDRNIAALGGVSISWLRMPDDNDLQWARMTAAFQKAQDLNMYIDDQTALSMLEIRSKARSVKRKSGLDMLVIDQLSFIAGGESENQWQVVGEHTRGLLALSKELDIAVVLLCQLNRKCEDRNNKRPMLSDLAISGSIEQDAANVIFLYRDEIYNPDTRDKGICEVITAKQRQGSPGVVALAYIGSQAKFENLAREWVREEEQKKPMRRGFE